MNQSAEPIEAVIERARQGDRQSREVLAQALTDRLRVDVYRLTLDKTTTEEIVQECLLQVFESLHRLRQVNSFWGWAYKIAVNKVRENHRKQTTRREVTLESIQAASNGAEGSPDAVAETVSKEVKQTVIAAMSELTPDQRAVLTMRCYRNMGYAEIAQSLGCGQFAARMRFHRAKKALGARLAKRGLGRGTLIVALLIFGKYTAESEAAVTALTLTGASLKVGAPAAAAAFILSKTGIVTVATIAAIGIGGTAVEQARENRSFYTAQNTIVAIAENSSPYPANYRQQWSFYYPQGADGPVMMHIMQAPSDRTALYCTLRQDVHGNYFRGPDDSIYLENHCPYNTDLTVMRLPTDAPSLRQFLTAQDGSQSTLEFVSAAEPGLLIVSDSEGRTSTTVHRYYIVEQEGFSYDFPAAKVIDRRDAMHKRGWTCFKLSGELNGQTVTGRGRIPFNYISAAQNSPWIRIQTPDSQLTDDSFEGLARPWTGLHTIDVVRRDAAKAKAPFQTCRLAGTQLAAVAVNYPNTDVQYLIDLDHDIIIKMTFSGALQGQITFEYVDNVENAPSSFVKPPNASSHNLLQCLLQIHK